ncbi:MAG: hypothetical protein ACOCUS_02425 [Polyangiales bacterium]
MRTGGKITVLVLGALVLWPSLAQAEGWQWRRGGWSDALRRQHGGVAGELGLFAGERRGTKYVSASPRLGFWWNPAEHFELSADWGMAYWKADQDGGATEKEFRFGNPVVNGYWIGPAGDMVLAAGAGIGIPAATLPDDTLGRGQARNTYSYAAATRGLWNVWEWYPGALTVVVPARLETKSNRHLLAALDASMGIPIHVRYGDGAELVLQWAGEIGYRHQAVSFGARMQFVWLATKDEDDVLLDSMLQMALEPFFRINIGQGFIHTRLTMNLDDPFGWSFDDGPRDIWGLHLGGGGRW